MGGRHTPEKPSGNFDSLLALIRTLRGENGCPWDKKQTPKSFHPYILEEYHELIQAMDKGEPTEILDEMGDLIFLVVFVAYMYEQKGVATISEILGHVIEKMRRRHPHVFADVQVNDAQDVVANWRKIKAGEKTIRQRESILDGIPRSLPALSRAQKLSARAARVGFDWTTPQEVFRKIDEEYGELEQAVSAGASEKIREELGDLIFVIVNAARHLNVNSEAALDETSDKFEQRFRFVEKSLKARGKSLEESNMEEMDLLWDQAKKEESSHTP